jgi:hypothetical protein
MVSVSKNPLYIAKSGPVEANAWVNSSGKNQYPGERLIVIKQGNEWHVYKG